MLTPSSNTVLEPVTTALLAGRPVSKLAVSMPDVSMPDVSMHVSRFRVTEIALSENASKQFDESAMLTAAELLADAKVDVIAWNGTSASWLGFDRDERLCERITAATGVPACTSVLAFREILALTSVTRLGLVTPYAPDVQARIIDNWADAGIQCAAERHLDLADNFAFATVEDIEIARLVREVARDGCEAIAILCTNLRGALVAAGLEAELGLPVYDSVAVTLWKCLSLAVVETEAWRGFGSVFALPAPGNTSAAL